MAEPCGCSGDPFRRRRLKEKESRRGGLSLGTHSNPGNEPSHEFTKTHVADDPVDLSSVVKKRIMKAFQFSLKCISYKGTDEKGMELLWFKTSQTLTTDQLK